MDVYIFTYVYIHIYQDGWSLLMWMSFKGHSSVVEKLILAGANLDLQNKVSESSVLLG